ncbi:PREDICTED: uncharacterized protein LOC106813807 [Priapulus caudatus]|uniref:Uncharacterized protein LOC106813807 n=1 Tax=Priapulus caudatus TaxID=37621 RepID=A0ABM1EMU9_PRICU|nr:PREDICTED: uncharacterized protein LOC106813807 [Priapulus caudatus]
MQRLQQIMQCAKRVFNIPQDIIDLIDKAIVLSINIQELHTALPLMPAKTVHDGGRHRPTYDIAEEQLRYLVCELQLSVSDCSAILQVSRQTIYNRMTAFQIPKRCELYRSIDDNGLDEVVRNIKQEFPNAGLRMTLGLLRSRKIYAARDQVMKALWRVDPVGVFSRSLRLNVIERHEYSIHLPMLLWHIDGYHKLIRCIFSSP